MTVQAVANRGFNLLATAMLGLGGVTFGSVFFQEADAADKIDDGGFLLIAVAALTWYLWSQNRFSRSLAPVAIAVLAIAVQVLGLVFERDDPRAFGDNIGGALYFGVVVALLAIQYRRKVVA